MQDILFAQQGALGLITLNRPKALNALTLEMIRALHPQLTAWAIDPSIKAVAIRGAGDRAFCAGGDVRAVWYAAKAGSHAPGGSGHMASDFFREEYQLNRTIHLYPKPYIALIDGITMGGGVGLSIHGKRRIATEKTLFAMPETAIGFFPDVGGSYFLSRMEGGLGLYLALTGERLHAADCLAAGIATDLVASAAMPALLEALSQGQALPTTRPAELEAAQLPAIKDAIARCFVGKASVLEIVAALETESSPWAKATLNTLAKRSPASLAISFLALQRGKTLAFDDCMKMEYRLSQALMQPGSDFFEGIRAVLVDKDHAPRWRHARLADVLPAEVETCFAPLGKGELTF